MLDPFCYVDRIKCKNLMDSNVLDILFKSIPQTWVLTGWMEGPDTYKITTPYLYTGPVLLVDNPEGVEHFLYPNFITISPQYSEAPKSNI